MRWLATILLVVLAGCASTSPFVPTPKTTATTTAYTAPKSPERHKLCLDSGYVAHADYTACIEAEQSPSKPYYVDPGDPSCAENGSCYGDISDLTGRPKTTHVDGYYRKDGTYVRGHYRS